MADPIHSLSAYSSPAWSPGKMQRISCANGLELALESVRVQGISALLTPSWALEVPGAEASACEPVLRNQRGLVVLDFTPEISLSVSAWQAAGWHLQERHTRWLDLTDDFEEHLPKNRRKQLRRAHAAGFEVLPLDDMQILAATHAASRNRKSIANDDGKLLSLLNRLNEAEEIHARGIRKPEGGWLATAGFVRAGQRWVYAFGGATEHSSDSAAAIVMLLTHAMREASEAGMQVFDFGGSADTGVDKFYAEFGARKVPRWRAVKTPTWARMWLQIRRPDLFA